MCVTYMCTCKLLQKASLKKAFMDLILFCFKVQSIFF